MVTYISKWPVYAKEWDGMSIRPSKVSTFNTIAKKLIANKTRYQTVEKSTGVPWYMVALLHMRESDNNFNTQLAQGDPLNRKSTHVPRGYGPYKTWEDSAYDALVGQKGYNKIKDWRLEKILYYSEAYNGWGYYNHGVPSAYLWAGSTVYNGGKYVSDGVWSSSAMDVQPGVAPVLKAMMALDPSIKLLRESTLPTPAVGGTGTGVVIAAGAGAAAAQPHLWPYILAGTVTALVVGFIAYRIYKGTTNV